MSTKRVIYSKTQDGTEIAVIDGIVALRMSEIDPGQFIIKQSETNDPETGWVDFCHVYANDVVTSKADFYEFVMDIADHMLDVKRLGRTEEETKETTPWGQAIKKVDFGEGITWYSTGMRFGFHVVDMTGIPGPLQEKNGWYADFTDDCKLVIARPDRFTNTEYKDAKRELLREHPDIALLLGIEADAPVSGFKI